MLQRDWLITLAIQWTILLAVIFQNWIKSSPAMKIMINLLYFTTQPPQTPAESSMATVISKRLGVTIGIANNLKNNILCLHLSKSKTSNNSFKRCFRSKQLSLIWNHRNRWEKILMHYFTLTMILTFVS